MKDRYVILIMEEVNVGTFDIVNWRVLMDINKNGDLLALLYAGEAFKRQYSFGKKRLAKYLQVLKKDCKYKIEKEVLIDNTKKFVEISQTEINFSLI